MICPPAAEPAAQEKPVSRSCRALSLCKDAFYAWKAEKVSWRDWNDMHLANVAREVHAKDPAFRYRLIDDEPALTRGHQIGPTRVAFLGRENGIASVIVKRRGRGKPPERIVHDDHM